MRIALYVLAGLLSFCVFIIVFLPAAPVWRFLQPDVNTAVPDLVVYRVGGTVWTGEAELQYRQFPLSEANWTLAALPLLGGTAALGLDLSGPGLTASAAVSASGTQIEVTGLNGEISADYVNALSSDFGLTFAGDLTVVNLSLQAEGERVTAADGFLNWSGGRILFRANNTMEAITLPPLEGTIDADSDGLHLTITHATEPLLLITLKNTGWAAVEVKARLFQLADLPLPGNPAADDPVVMLEEKIL